MAYDHEKLIDSIAEAMIEYTDKVKKILGELTDEELAVLPDRLDSTQHQNCKGFRVTEWDDVGDLARGELGFRKMCRRAEKLNLPAYCPACDGACDMGEEHDKNAEKKRGRRMSPEEFRLNEMSRKDLIQEVLKLQTTLHIQRMTSTPREPPVLWGGPDRAFVFDEYDQPYVICTLCSERVGAADCPCKTSK